MRIMFLNQEYDKINLGCVAIHIYIYIHIHMYIYNILHISTYIFFLLIFVCVKLSH